jgi:hypothetical protein
MLSYDKMTTLSVGSQDQLDGMASKHGGVGVGITTGPFISIGFPSTILQLPAMDHSQ